MEVSFYDTNLKEEDVDSMNSESAPLELKRDVFKPLREKVDPTNPDQAKRVGRVRNKVVAKLKETIWSRSRRLSLDSVRPTSKRGNLVFNRYQYQIPIPIPIPDTDTDTRYDKNTSIGSGMK